MGIFSGVRRLTGAIDVRCTGNIVSIDGVNGFAVCMDIGRLWGTSKLANNMFNIASRSRLVFKDFFLVEVHYVIQKLLTQKRLSYPRVHYEKILRLLETKTWLNNLLTPTSDILDFSKLSNFKDSVKPKPVQLDFLKIYNESVPKYRLNGYLLTMPPGTGKTLANLYLAECLKADKIIIICPKNARDNVWAKTVAECYKTPVKWWAVGESNTYGTEPDDARIYIYHYEALDQAVEFAKRIRGKNHRVYVGLDECHNMNTPTSLRTQLFIQLCKIIVPISTIMSSGTPIKEAGYELVTAMYVIDRAFDDDCADRWKAMFGRDSSRANDVVCNRMGLIRYEVEKTTVVTTPIEYHEIKVKIPNSSDYTLDEVRLVMQKYVEERTAYYQKDMNTYMATYTKCLEIYKNTLRNKEAIREYNAYVMSVNSIRRGYDPIAHKEDVKFCNMMELKKIIPSLPQDLKKEFNNVRTIVKYVQLKVLGEALGNVLNAKRMQCHYDMIPYLGLTDIINNAVKKTVIFTSYVEVADEIQAYLKRQGIPCLLVHGGTNKDLVKIIHNFEHDDSIPVLVATYKSLSTAVPLPWATDVVLVNAPWRDYEKDQAISRCWRLGQTETTHVWSTYLDTGEVGNISTRAKEILEWSESQVNAILGREGVSQLEASAGLD